MKFPPVFSENNECENAVIEEVAPQNIIKKGANVAITLIKNL